MSSEQPKLNPSEAENKPTSGEPEAAPQTADVSNQPTAVAAKAPELDDAEEARSGADVDFGQLLDQFEQEQATLED